MRPFEGGAAAGSPALMNQGRNRFEGGLKGVRGRARAGRDMATQGQLNRQPNRKPRFTDGPGVYGLEMRKLIKGFLRRKPPPQHRGPDPNWKLAQRLQANTEPETMKAAPTIQSRTWRTSRPTLLTRASPIGSAADGNSMARAAARTGALGSMVNAHATRPRPTAKSAQPKMPDGETDEPCSLVSMSRHFSLELDPWPKTDPAQRRPGIGWGPSIRTLRPSWQTKSHISPKVIMPLTPGSFSSMASRGLAMNRWDPT